MKTEARWHDIERVYYAANLADRDDALNSTAGDPPIFGELRRATVAILLRKAAASGQHVVKVCAGSEPIRPSVSGYATFLDGIAGCDLPGLERKLGFKTGVLRDGARLYRVDRLSLGQHNVVPRGSTDWSAGLSPRDLHNLSASLSRTTGSAVAVGNHPGYPSSTDPVIQFVIRTEVPYAGQPRFVAPGESV